MNKKQRFATMAAIAGAGFTGLQRANDGHETLQKWYQKYQDKYSFVLRISDKDPLYRHIEDELIPQLGKLHSLEGHFERSKNSDPIWFSYPGKGRVHRVVIDGESVRVEFAKTDDGGADPKKKGLEVGESIFAGMGATKIAPKYITFTCPSEKARNAVSLWVAALAENMRLSDRVPELHIVNRWGDWSELKDIPPRSLESVVLPDGQMECIVDDLCDFMMAHERYAELAIPWHRGYLFSGAPGTGKTSIARALASHFGLDLWYIPLSDVKLDTGLISLVSQIRGGILLLEDIDVVHAATSRDDEDEITLSGLLNSLDGVGTPNGLITIMTTNDVSQLDPALIRPGRVDMHEVIDYATPDQVSRIYERFYGEPFELQSCPQITTADVSEALKRHLDDPMGGMVALSDMLMEAK